MAKFTVTTAIVATTNAVSTMETQPSGVQSSRTASGLSGCRVFMKAIAGSKMQPEGGLAFNGIPLGADFYEALGKYFKRMAAPHRCDELCLNETNMGDAEAKLLAKALLANDAVAFKFVHVPGNPFGKDGKNAILKAVEKRNANPHRRRTELVGMP